MTIVINEGDNHFDGRSSSAAKKADALFKISLARFASASSARKRRFSASKSTDSVGVALPESGTAEGLVDSGVYAARATALW
ncbi:hypothetical protein HLA91_11580 [Brevibacterium luteolum]|uniref:Uncharacterized protein n=1 Tax=Brevibacterium luteolum TaxID=199591 RepID=A0A849AVF9_9MICO|nr:hypothetical protein [Brevibacterium luteolum]